MNYRKIAMAIWKFKCYEEKPGRNLWHEWYFGNPNAQSNHDAVLNLLVQQNSWKEPHVKAITSYKGIFEIRLRSSDVPWRICGFYEKGYTFVVVKIGYHQGKKYYPKKLFDIAITRKTEIETGKAKAVNCEYPRQNITI